MMERAVGPRPRTGPRRASGDEAVTEVVGSILLVATTVVLTGIVSALVASSLHPTERYYADLVVRVEDGGDGWATGNEALRLAHRGGQALPTSLTRIVLAGPLTLDLRGTALSGPFGDGRLTIGETWIRTLTLGACDALGVQVVLTGERGSSHLVLDQRLVGDPATCPGV